MIDRVENRFPNLQIRGLIFVVQICAVANAFAFIISMFR